MSVNSYTCTKESDFSRIIVVMPTKIKLLRPFDHNNADSGRFTNIPLRSLRQIPGILQSRIKNLHLFPLRVVINDRTPTVVTMNGGTYVGQDGAFAAVLAAKMNATPVYISDKANRAKIYYGYKRTSKGSDGTFAGLIDGWADISVNGHFLKDYHCYSAELTRHVSGTARSVSVKQTTDEYKIIVVGQ